MPPKGGFKRKAAASDGTATPNTPSLAEQFSYIHLPKPFKNPNYTKNVNRRAKNMKNVLSQERERERAEREKKRQEKMDVEKDENGMDVDDNSNEGSKIEEDIPTYSSIEAPPSVLPQKKYCDITGLDGPYTDPATGLRYHDKSVYEVVKGLSASSAKDYLAARGVSSIVK